MAEKLKTQTLNIPSEVVDSDWRDDIDTDYATQTDASQDFEIYGNNETQEGEYISPNEVSQESLEQIKSFQVKLAAGGLRRFRQQELAKVA